MPAEIIDNLDLLFEVLPSDIRTACEGLNGERKGLVEIVLDLGRAPFVRLEAGDRQILDRLITESDLEFIVKRLGTFSTDNRAGISGTLHRISAIRNRTGEIVGITCRIGRAVPGAAAIIAAEIRSGKSILVLGGPGVGKTTILREAARLAAESRRVIVIDTSNEIAGDGNIPHPAIGSARRMQVPDPARQHAVMIEAVENHMPQVIVIDEIGTADEAAAARTINERGVQLIGTAHGEKIQNLMLNPTLVDLLGGITSVTLGDDTARQRGTAKTVLERKSPPTFDVLVELIGHDHVAVFDDVAAAIDLLLHCKPAPAEERQGEDGIIQRHLRKIWADPERFSSSSVGSSIGGGEEFADCGEFGLGGGFDRRSRGDRRSSAHSRPDTHRRREERSSR